MELRAVTKNLTSVEWMVWPSENFPIYENLNPPPPVFLSWFWNLFLYIYIIEISELAHFTGSNAEAKLFWGVLQNEQERVVWRARSFLLDAVLSSQAGPVFGHIKCTVSLLYFGPYLVKYRQSVLTNLEERLLQFRFHYRVHTLQSHYVILIS